MKSSGKSKQREMPFKSKSPSQQFNGRGSAWVIAQWDECGAWEKVEEGVRRRGAVMVISTVRGYFH